MRVDVWNEGTNTPLRWRKGRCLQLPAQGPVFEKHPQSAVFDLPRYRFGVRLVEKLRYMGRFDLPKRKTFVAARERTKRDCRRLKSAGYSLPSADIQFDRVSQHHSSPSNVKSATCRNIVRLTFA
jgi:hypothetical protein